VSVYQDSELRNWAKDNVTPYEEKNINPASLDLMLGSEIKVPMWYWGNSFTRWIVWKFRSKLNLKMWSDGIQFETFTLWPGKFVLCHSLEITNVPNNAIALLFSKSSTGRIGLEHLHAGFGDSGFKGQWTWEFENVAPWPIELIAGKRLMQVALIQTLSVPETLYGQVGRYQGQMGATAPRKERVL